MFLQLKITLENVKPPVWRRIVLSDELSLFQLHNTIQIAFNWTNMHLYQFKIGDIKVDMDGGFGLSEESEGLNVKDVKLKDFSFTEKDTFKYWYDFGDDWMHQIQVEKISQLGPKYPVCLAGKRNAPPEDCGGPWGYQHLMDRMASKKLNAEEKEFLVLYDPEYFDITEVNDILSDEEAINEEDFFDDI
ncbi:MAG: plasmid pRiA4b ORF-3 family protein [Bacteroidales bacterium]|nr:plasmid pRiA4b ORF-3 family protein [Bacteroidales bacterium]